MAQIIDTVFVNPVTVQKEHNSFEKDEEFGLSKEITLTQLYVTRASCEEQSGLAGRHSGTFDG